MLLGNIFLLSSIASWAATLSNCDETSLRQALTNGGTITFACDGTITLSATLVVSRDTVLDGNGRQVTLSGGNAVRVLEVNSGVRFSIRGLTIANGAVIGTNGLAGAPGQDAFGAGILNHGILGVVNCAFRNNAVTGGTGGATPNGNGGDARGASINSDGGHVWATNCIFVANSCTGGNGGGSFVTGRGGNGGDAVGGAFFAELGRYGFFQCHFASNVVTGGAPGGPFTYGHAGSAYGGAIGSMQSTGAVADGVLIANRVAGASMFSGGLGSGEARGGAVFNGSGELNIFRTLLVSNVAVSGSATSQGIRGAAHGGAIANGGVLTISDSYVRNNMASGGSNLRGEMILAFGGGLDNWDQASATGCTFEANEAIGGFSQFSIGGPNPGGDAYGGAVHTSNAFAATNCTFAANVARGGGSYGQGMVLGGLGAGPAGVGKGGAFATGGTILLSHVTVASNIAINGIGAGETEPASGRGGGIYVSNNAPVLQNSIVAYSQVGSNAFGALVDAGNNISSDASCQFTQAGSRNNVDPLLSPLADFGGPTPTMALLAGSSAIDAALSSLCVPTDQRGRARPWGVGCDVGAFESSPPFTVRGTIHGFRPPQGVVVQCGSVSGSTDANGNYTVFGIDAGSHNLVPSAPDTVVIPNSRALSVLSDFIDVDFKAYRFNGLTVEAVSNQDQTVVLAGEPADRYEVQQSQAIAGPWTILSTNTVGPNGIVTFQAPLIGATSYLRAQQLTP